jgi:hypothetical protein
MSATRRMEIGFEAAGGEVLVDEASLRAVRFPSANLLACEELHAVTPTFVRDLRIRYKRIPAALDNKLLGLNRVAVYKQGGTDAATIYTDEQAFLHNGRLDDVGSVWTYVPEAMGFSVVLSQPAWVSHLVLYLNNATPDNVYRTISILANDMETKMPRCVAMVRNNRRRFIVVHFDAPVRTDSLKVLPGHQARAHRDCLTEVEVYGPLGGPDQGQAARRFPDDPNGWPMFMGCPSHAPAVRPVDLAGTFRPAGRVHLESPAFFVGPTVTAGLCTFGDADGSIRSMTIPTPPPPEPPADAGAGAAAAAAGAKPKPKPKPSGSPDPKSRPQPGPSWVLGTVTPITTPARYAGRLFAGCADEKLHAVADNGAHLWAFQTEGRVYSSPLPDGDDVYFGCDDGKLYKVDADSGILLWELPTGGPIRGAPAMAEGRVFAPSWDGLLYAVAAETGREAWRTPIAKFTRGSPAVAGGRVYLGDEEGVGRSFEASSGKGLWQTPVGGRIVACPVVTEGGVVMASEQGHLAMLALADGKAVWSRKLEAAVRGQPVATRSQLLVPTAAGLEVLRLADGRADERVKLLDQPAGVTAAIPYGGRICVLTATAKAHEVNGRSYVRFDGAATLWVAEDKAAAGGTGGGK